MKTEIKPRFSMEMWIVKRSEQTAEEVEYDSEDGNRND
jgi:hypothetical protein